MIGFKRTVCAVLLFLLTGTVVAQNNTNSPYTRYGLGDLSGQNVGGNMSMGGIAVGIRDNAHINPLNPASYSAVDSLTFLFEAGISLQNTNYSDGIQKLNAKNSSFDYFAMQFRLHRLLGFSLGVLPFSSVGYRVGDVSKETETSPAFSKQMNGEGGLHQVYAGLGLKLCKYVSVGANISFLWGKIDRELTVIYPSYSSMGGTSPSYSERTSLRIKNYKLDVGVQYTQPIGDKHSFTLGATYTPKHDLKPEANVVTTTSVITDNKIPASAGLPNMFAAGVSYTYDKRLTVGADYNLQKWSEVDYDVRGKNIFGDYSKIAVGADFLPSLLGRNYFQLVHYRIGAYYTSPYYKTEAGKKAAREFGVTAGFGLPIPRTRSELNIGFQYANLKGLQANMVDQNTFRVTLGITFNERWFFKRKVY